MVMTWKKTLEVASMVVTWWVVAFCAVGSHKLILDVES